MAETSPVEEGGIDLQQALQHSMQRAFFGMVLVVCLLGAVVMPLLASRLGWPLRLAMLLAYGAVAATAWIGLRLPVARAGRAVAPLVLLGIGAVTMVAVGSGWGLQTPGLLFFGMAVCLVYALGPGVMPLAVCAAALTVVLGLGGAELAGWLVQPVPAPSLAQRVLLHCATILAGALVGRAVAVALREHVLAAGEREQHLRGLLAMAASAYWETDADLRLTVATWRNRKGEFVPMRGAVGVLPWELAGFGLNTESGAQLRLAMQERRQVRELASTWDSHGELSHFILNAEPRVSAEGRFIGYWGVSRDVTAEQQARSAQARTQALLSAVVAMSPDVIALTEEPSGCYVMVSTSFTRVLGHAESEVVGRTALDLGLWRDPAQRDWLMRRMLRRGASHDAPQEALVEMVAKDGRIVPLMFAATFVSVDGRRYVLTNSRDMTESMRVRMEREAILANASVGIAFTRDQHFELVNAQFERMFGWTPGNLVGQPGRCLFVSDADYAEVLASLGPLLARGEAVDIERRMARRDGSTFQARLRAKAVDPQRPGIAGTIWIAEDVTDARAAEQALARALDAAEAASRAKSDFLANTSHELRTPLNGLTGLARLARQPGLAPERLRQYLEQIDDSAQLLSTILSDILDLAKIEAGKLQLEQAPFDLPALLRGLQQAYGALAEHQGLAFSAELDPALPTWVMGDGMRVRQLLTNFLHNALKFTPQGTVRLVARPLAGARVRLEVHDTGPGLDAATQARLFQPFTQADASTTRRFGGTGLGLSICRELVTLMGGSIGVHSRPGEGSCFHAELPLPAVPAPLVSSTLPDAADQRLHGAHVLLVEDNPINTMVCEALLDDWQVRVTSAGDGAQALAEVARAAAAGWMFDAVLMDVQMPGMSGYEATAQLRRQYSPAELPVIALTAGAMVSDRARALDQGMTDFLSKPIDPQRLHAALLRALPPRSTA